MQRRSMIVAWVKCNDLKYNYNFSVINEPGKIRDFKLYVDGVKHENRRYIST